MSNYRSFTNILQNDNIVLTFGTDNEAVWVERFGSGFQVSGFGFQVDNPQPETQNPELFFTVHNTLTETVPFTLTADAAAPGIAGTERLTVAELVSGNAVQHEVQGDLLLIWGELAPLDTVVFRLEEGLVPTTVYLPLIQKASEGIMDPINGG